MRLYNAIIVDDERNIREALGLMIAEHCPEINICGAAASAAEARELLRKQQVDFIFLDISMPEEDGFALLKTIQGEHYGIIFVTAFEEYAVNAIKANAIDYILKPVLPNELKDAVAKAIRNHELRITRADVRIIYHKSLEKLDKAIGTIARQSHQIVVEDQFGYRMVRAADLMYLEADNSYTILHIAGLEKIMAAKSLREFEKSLEGNLFFRIHKSYLINLNYLRSFSTLDGNMAVLTDGTQLQVSRRKISEFREALKQFINR
jgi:two-component system LytT family response regulator